MNLHFVNVVWGAAYTDTFLKVSLPSMLTTGNLEYVGKTSDSSYTIYTTEKDAETITKSKTYCRLSELMRVDFAGIRGEVFEDDPNERFMSPLKYSTMSECHSHFIRSAQDDGVPFVFLSPDLVWADGSIANLVKIAQSGKRLVLMTGLRLRKESFILEFLNRKDGEIQPISSRELVKLALDHLHPEMQSAEWESEKSNHWPSLLLWKVKQEGLLVRAFHLHPILINPVRRDIVPETSIDDAYIDKICPDPKDEYVIQDSDEIVAFELTRERGRTEMIEDQRKVPQKIGEWAQNHTRAKHRELLNYKIRLHCNDLSQHWQEYEKKSDEIVNEINAFIIKDNFGPFFLNIEA